MANQSIRRKGTARPGLALDRFSKRLWGQQARAGRPEIITVDKLIQKEEAEDFSDAIRAYGRKVRPLPFGKLANRLQAGADKEMVTESAAFLVTGILALAASSELNDDSRGALLKIFVQAAFGLDDLSRELRKRTLTGLRGWPEFPDDDSPFGAFGEGCLERIRTAAGRAWGFIQSAQGAAAIVSVDADGITSLDPSEGNAGDVVRIRGNFQMPQPPGRTVLFPRAGGGTLPATLAEGGWTQTVIEVTVPGPAGDGPVGFTTDSGHQDPTAIVELSDALATCLGPRAVSIAGRLNNLTPGNVLTPRRPIPTLPGNANVFHGGPVLSTVSPPDGTELSPPFTITGLNLRMGDTVYVDGKTCPTTFVNATQLKFRIPAIQSGQKLLQIGRSYHRSNGIGFDVRATLNITPTLRRVLPDSSVSLNGTGFGPTTTATVDGLPAHLYVVDTHTIEVRVTRPTRVPRLDEKRGEPVTVEVFDRLVSLGKITVLVATFRIATFGDSIVWGQGLMPAQRFPMLVADMISARRNGRIAVFAVDHCAHSGAVLLLPGSEPANRAVPRLPTDFNGECPNPGASIRAQVAAWPARLASEVGEIELIILNGGINDVGVRNILDPSPAASDTALAGLTNAACGRAMTSLLPIVVNTFPSARIIVTGYYAIVSEQSNLDFLVPLLSSLGLLAGLVTPVVTGGAPIGFGLIEADIFKIWLRKRLGTRSNIFARIANAALAQAVATTRSAFPALRIGLAIPAFGAENAIFAPDPYVFGVTPSFGAEDPVAALRGAACGRGFPLPDIASIGHPNAKGAQAYADAISAVLPSVGL